jgi:hypothetical protein
MSMLRVNLLKKAERRYQGAVSRRFMLISLVITPILLIAVLSSVKLIQYAGVRAELAASRDIWDALKTRQAAALEQQRGLTMNRKAIELINSWKASQVSMDLLLTDIQKLIPDNMQLKRVSIRSATASSLFRDTEELELDFRLVLQGVSQGAQAEDAVISLRRDLLMREHLSAIFDSVKLTSMRKLSGQDGENIREFSLEGLAPERGEDL